MSARSNAQAHYANTCYNAPIGSRKLELGFVHLRACSAHYTSFAPTVNDTDELRYLELIINILGGTVKHLAPVPWEVCREPVREQTHTGSERP